jgi:hypothetical protein
MENLSWLFWGYAIAWMLAIAYLVMIARREQVLRKRVAELQEMMEERWRQK